jgi:glycosyltransferase involved in cell wall biosynthesis
MADQVSVITPCLNPGRFLLPCLESVQAQGDRLRRHIVIDGGSTDGSLEVLKQFGGSHAKFYWASGIDKGQSDALNKALELVDTEYFGWLNADDKYCQQMMDKLLDPRHEEEGRPVIIYGDYMVVDEHEHILRRRRQPTFSYWDCLFGYLTVQNCGALFRADKAREAGGFDLSLEFAMDYDLVLKLGLMGEVRHVREYAGCFRMHESSKTSRLQDVCGREIDALRRKHSGCSGFGLRWRYAVSKIKVAMRMIAQGCISCRLPGCSTEERS